MDDPENWLDTLALDRNHAAPLHRQLHERIREAILDGELLPGSRLPSTRSLAAQIGAARQTVERAYETLGGEGLIVARGAAGTTVHPDLAGRAGRRAAAVDTVHPPGLDPPALPRPFQMGLPALDAFPRKLWARLVARQARCTGGTSLAHPDPMGHPALRRAIAAHLTVARGLACTPERVIITSGFQGALALVAATVLRRGDLVWIEDPGYFMAYRALELLGMRKVPVPTDGEGLDPAAGRQLAPVARLVFVTPSHQMPTGVSLSLRRRLDLLGWASAVGAWILEDDYDGEYRYTGPPLPALAGLDRSGRVLYAGTFSKVLFPSLRLGWLVVPASEVERFAGSRAALNIDVPSLEQAVVAEFIAEGHFARHIRRMRSLYATRRQALASALETAFDDAARVDLHSGGMHLILRFPPDTDDVALAARARADGFAAEPLRPLGRASDPGAGLLLSFANVTPEAAQGLATRLAASVLSGSEASLAISAYRRVHRRAAEDRQRRC